MDRSKIPQFLKLFEEYKTTDAYKDREDQRAITPVFKEIIWEALKIEPFTNQQLTDFIHIFKHNSSDENFDKKLIALVKDAKKREELSAKAYEIYQPGYTNAGKTGIISPTPKQAKRVKQFLLDAFNVKTTEDAIALCKNFDSENIPEVKKGIYSPLLYYINPEIFPIVNQSQKKFSSWMNLADDYPTLITEYTELNKLIKEPEFAQIDFFAHLFTEDGRLNYRKKLYLEDKQLYKISHGIFVKRSDFAKSGIIKVLEENNWICLSKYTESGKKGDEFLNEMQNGDFVYICYGGDSIYAVAKVLSDAVPLPEDVADMINDDDEEWIYRKVELLYKPFNPDIRDLKTFRSQTMPSGNSTFWNVTNSLQKLNEDLFIPKFNLEILNNKQDDTVEDDEESDNNQSNQPMSLNTILYGPPGTGKTYQLLKLIDEWELIEETTQDLQYESFLQDLTWWQVIALTLLELKTAPVTQILEHPLVKAKFSISSIQNKRARVWSTLQNHTVDDCENVKYRNRHGIQLFYKEKNSEWRLDDAEQAKSELEEVINQLEEIKSQGKTTAKKNYSFITCHQSLSYEDFIEGIKPVAKKSETQDEEESSLEYEVKKGIFYIACERAAQLAGYNSLEDCLVDDKKERKRKFADANNNDKKYVVFLDEINRCNVSSVFGELITLIEDDKRLGAENEMDDIILPYSQTYFGVPANLYIVGTMNTADRSVEALDTALRRRFSFTPKLPEENKLSITKDGIDLSKLLHTINTRLRVLKDNDHTIGHAWLWNVKDLDSLKAVFRDKILPLLQEYFYNDYEKLGLVLGDSFFEKQEQISSDIFAKFSGGNGLAGQYDQSWQYQLKSVDKLNLNHFKMLEVLISQSKGDEEE